MHRTPICELNTKYSGWSHEIGKGHDGRRYRKNYELSGKQSTDTKAVFSEVVMLYK